jgi:hypothetical protein
MFSMAAFREYKSSWIAPNIVLSVNHEGMRKALSIFFAFHGLTRGDGAARSRKLQRNRIPGKDGRPKREKTSMVPPDYFVDRWRMDYNGH